MITGIAFFTPVILVENLPGISNGRVESGAFIAATPILALMLWRAPTVGVLIPPPRFRKLDGA